MDNPDIQAILSKQHTTEKYETKNTTGKKQKISQMNLTNTGMNTDPREVIRMQKMNEFLFWLTFNFS